MSKKIVIGTAQFGMKYGISNKIGKIKSSEIFKILNYSKNNGIKYLDTANAYEKSENEIGNYLKKTKNKFNVITKYSFKNNLNLEDQFFNSIRSLGCIPNIILAHNYKDYLNPTFHKIIKKIKKKYFIKYVGVSLYNVNQLNKILKYKKPDIIQVPLNILDKSFLNKDIIKNLKRKKILIHGRSIFLQGLFFKSKKFVFKNFKNIEAKYKLLTEIANTEKMNLGELSLCWAFNLKDIDNIVVGIDSFTHLKKNINIIKKKLSKNTYSQIDKINIKNNKIIKPYLWKKI